MRRCFVGLVLILVVAVQTAAQSDNEEDRAIALLEKQGVSTRYFRLSPKTPVNHVTIPDCTRADEKAPLLAKFKYLRTLNLLASDLTDEGLKSLAGLEGLETLQLYHNKKVTGKGFVVIDQSVKKALAWVKFLAKEKGLDVNHLTEHDLVGQVKWPGLRKLNLAASGVTDEGMKGIGVLRDLTHLDLKHTEITDESVRELAKLKNLRQLDLMFTKLSEKGMQQLQEALPQCVIGRVEW